MHQLKLLHAPGQCYASLCIFAACFGESCAVRTYDYDIEVLKRRNNNNGRLGGIRMFAVHGGYMTLKN